MQVSKFVTTKYIAETYEISISRAHKHKQNMIKMFDIDLDRLPRKGVIPIEIVNKYFNQNYRKKQCK